ncbi:S8 family peptidase [Cellulomonas denverensis]|uniref:S8 family peptidase n=1 Tax=Cellulomonas denverensis TaxID=264297 RepID=UPI001FF80416|nr:S8 family peptidase [Cellulomonas denverensis]
MPSTHRRPTTRREPFRSLGVVLTAALLGGLAVPGAWAGEAPTPGATAAPTTTPGPTAEPTTAPRPTAPTDTPTATPSATPAPTVTPSASPADDTAPMIVTLAPGTNAAATAAAATAGDNSTVEDVFPAVAGFAAELTDQAIAELDADPRVLAIEPDRPVAAMATQRPPSWGLDRIDQQKLPLSGTYTYAQTGKGVTAYVIDSGILAGHREFTGRVRSGFTAVQDGKGTTDCLGHGTHVAGTLGGTTYGVAKQVTLVPVRVLNCTGSGTSSQLIAGIDWVVADHKPGQPAVANISLGGAASDAIDAAVQRLVADGVTVVVAAGNGNKDACTMSPARAVNAVTVGATTRTDTRSSVSNWGRCLDLFAPGEAIVSASHRSTTATASMTGTSMAAPHVAGAAALVLQKSPKSTPAQVWSTLLPRTGQNLVKSAGATSKNRLLRIA